MTNKNIQDTFHTSALVGRFRDQRKIGFAKVLIREDKLHEALSQDLTMFGSYVRIARWSTTAGSRPVVRSAAKRPEAERQKSLRGFIETAMNFMKRMLKRSSY